MTRVHFMGIAGSGASAAAALAQTQGFEITGCDKEVEGEFTKPFNNDQLFEGHSPKHLTTHDENFIDILVYSPAITSLDPDNEEILEAKERKIPIITWQKFLGEYLLREKFVIAVCGTHGKSTTTAMAGKLLDDAKLDPNVVLGATMSPWKGNYRIGQGKYFVIEADEFNDNFLNYTPDITILTNIEMDHPEYFKDFESYKLSFEKFLLKTKKVIIANLQDQAVYRVVKNVMKNSSVLCIDYSKSDFGLKLKLFGKHNFLNAAAVFHLGLSLSIMPGKIKESLEGFKGIGRRFEYMGRFKGFEIYSDFAHHPTEVEVTLEAAREKFPDEKIWVIFQPHMFSRTYVLFDEFVRVIKEVPVDRWIVMDIYPSREKDTGFVNSKQLVEAVKMKNVEYIATGDEVLDALKRENEEGILMFMGAGSTHDLAKRLINSVRRA